MKPLQKPMRVGHASLARAIFLLLQGPATARSIAEDTGLSRPTVYEFMRAMCKQDAAHVCGKARDAIGRESLPIFSLGSTPKGRS